jgi:hypothetical protein
MRAASNACDRKHDWLLVFIGMEPDGIHWPTFVVEDELAAVIEPVDGPRYAVRELAFAELHQSHLMGIGQLFPMKKNRPENRRYQKNNCTYQDG